MHIYKTTCLANGKIYIGQKSNMRDVDQYYGSGVLIRRAIEKYGKESFIKEVIDTATSLEELCEKEKYWIKEYNSTDKNIGYNITPGGEFGDIFTNNPEKEEIRKKYSAAGKKKIGSKNPFYGKTHSDKTKEIIGSKNSEHAKLRKETYTEEDWKKYGMPGDLHPLRKKGGHSEETKELLRRKALERAKNRVKNKVIDELSKETVDMISKLYTVDHHGPVTISKIIGISYKKVRKILIEMNLREYK